MVINKLTVKKFKKTKLTQYFYSSKGSTNESTNGSTNGFDNDRKDNDYKFLNSMPFIQQQFFSFRKTWLTCVKRTYKILNLI